ncbi:C-type lectin BML-2-like [Gigantopelta aegis]|uniref:C-type lectin BML-2-like n=1 Tax=Gigantopelta aegis TaxID=1735272 RepID=UPI001B88BD79|nr:C-type lectin BML-2-like [Gigantopelta aegis]
MQFPSVRYMVMLVVICCTNVTPSCDLSQQSRLFKNYRLNDVEIANDVILRVGGVRTYMNCAWKCQENLHCVSFSYRHNGTCLLHAARFTNNASYLPLTGWSHYSAELDPCPTEDGYVLLDSVNVCFKAFNQKKSANDARDICSQSGDRLIILDTAEKNTAVSDYMVVHPGSDFYIIGLRDEQTEGVYIWNSGVTATFLKWNDGEPNSQGGNEDCVVLQTSRSSFHDITCTDARHFMCEKVI